jgi:serine protease Do
MTPGPRGHFRPCRIAPLIALVALPPSCRTPPPEDSQAQAASKVPGTVPGDSTSKVPGTVPGDPTGKVPGTLPGDPSSKVPGTSRVATADKVPGTRTGDVTPRLSVPEVAEQLTDAFANAAKAIRPSVVRIDVEIAARRATGDDGPAAEVPDLLRKFFGRGEPMTPQAPVRGTGSGVILDTNGDVVTNAHVVDQADKVTVTLIDGQKVPGKVVGRDRLTDLAVVRLTASTGPLTQARLGNSEQLRVGQWVLAVGSPLGLDQSVTAGIVSGLGTRGSRLRVSERARGYIQTDASINPGNSGGPLVNLAGEVIGINTMINVGPGGAYGYAIPVNQVAQVTQLLVKEGRVHYPYIGVNIQSVSDLSEADRQRLGRKLPPAGALVTGVIPGSPAALANLREGDVITKISAQKIETSGDVVDYVSSQAIGTKVRIEYFRDGESQSADVTLREIPSEDKGSEDSDEAGVSLQTLDDQLARSLGVPGGTKGAVVAEVKPDSPAASAGLREGDVIVEVDRKPVRSVEDAVGLLRAGGKRTHLLRVVGPNGPRFLTLNMR